MDYTGYQINNSRPGTSRIEKPPFKATLYTFDDTWGKFNRFDDISCQELIEHVLINIAPDTMPNFTICTYQGKTLHLSGIDKLKELKDHGWKLLALKVLE